MSEPKVIVKLNEHLGIDGCARFELGGGGLTRAVLSWGGAEAHVYGHGAHVTHYRPADGEPVLFVSERSAYESDKPIRGGVPVCFPWFAQHGSDASLPMHGFARTTLWKVRSVDRDDSGVSITHVLKSNARTRELWPHDFVATHTTTLNDALTMELWVKNLNAPGSAAGPNAAFGFEEALHTYFAVGDARQVAIGGLEQTQYLDKTQAMATRRQGGEPVRIEGETDRIYIDTAGACELRDPSMRRVIRVDKSGSRSTVVWNPWVQKAKAMADFGDDEWPSMVCIETCNVGADRVRLEPGESHTMTARIGCSRM